MKRLLEGLALIVALAVPHQTESARKVRYDCSYGAYELQVDCKKDVCTILQVYNEQGERVDLEKADIKSPVLIYRTSGQNICAEPSKEEGPQWYAQL